MRIFSNCVKNKLLRNMSSTYIRLAHTDIKFPNFDKYRRDSVRDPTSKTSESEDSRKAFSGAFVVAASVMGLYAVKAEIIRDVLFMAPSEEVLALAKIEINLNEIPEAKSATFKWRGKPLFVRRRTQKEIDIVRAVPLSSLRDPEDDAKRCIRPELLVVLGICTHLGCVPIADAGDYGPGGYYCPCHGSHFDASGRVRKGPAPTNMEVPPYSFVGDNALVVG